MLRHPSSGACGAGPALAELPDTATCSEAVVEIDAGGVVFHRANVIHPTSPNRTASHRRNPGFIYHGNGAKQDVKAIADYERKLSGDARTKSSQVLAEFSIVLSIGSAEAM